MFCADLAVAIDASFVHRARALEQKDGNPLNEMRMICKGIMSNGGTFFAEIEKKY